jgi:DNA-3-methyladenine glycosylase
MHYCCNVVVGDPGHASAVLLRAGEVVDGVELARARRSNGPDRDLARGPARLCQALGIDLSCNGVFLGEGGLTLTLPDEVHTLDEVLTGPRVGLRHAADHPWRFWLRGEPTVSVYRPAKKLGGPA